MRIDSNGLYSPSAPARADSRPAPVAAAERADLRRVTSAANDTVRAVATVASSVQFTIDQEAGRTVVRVVDKATGQLIRQIPSEEMIDIARALDRLQALLGLYPA